GWMAASPRTTTSNGPMRTASNCGARRCTTSMAAIPLRRAANSAGRVTRVRSSNRSAGSDSQYVASPHNLRRLNIGHHRVAHTLLRAFGGARQSSCCHHDPDISGFPLGVTSGTYDNTLDLTLASSYNPVFVTDEGGVPQAEAA